jgi:hypothetical protein
VGGKAPYNHIEKILLVLLHVFTFVFWLYIDHGTYTHELFVFLVKKFDKFVP